METIIFVSGLGVPKILAKSKFVWNDPIWKEYNRVYYTSKIPTSDHMVENEISNLLYLISNYPNCYLAGHSLGAWWILNLLYKNILVNKVILMTPLLDTKYFEIFNVTERYNPIYKPINLLHGSNKVLTLLSNNDYIVPAEQHSYPIANYLDSSKYILNGGHFFQSNHLDGLFFARNWLKYI
jgi:predicted alpha/beta hydrolase family esterase